MIAFEQLRPDEAQRLRTIRLQALQDAPDAFGTTFAEAAALALAVWTRQLVELPTFVAFQDGLDVGMVRCMRDRGRPDTAWLISMWVAPEVRRSGLGRSLVDLVVGWARSNGIRRLLLDVADLNAPAIALYDAKGFAPNGNTGTLPSPREHIREHQRELRLE